MSVVSVPVNIHTLIIKQNYLSSHLASALDMWMEADEYVAKNNIRGKVVVPARRVGVVAFPVCAPPVGLVSLVQSNSE